VAVELGFPGEGRPGLGSTRVGHCHGSCVTTRHRASAHSGSPELAGLAVPLLSQPDRVGEPGFVQSASVAMSRALRAPLMLARASPRRRICARFRSSVTVEDSRVRAASRRAMTSRQVSAKSGGFEVIARGCAVPPDDRYPGVDRHADVGGCRQSRWRRCETTGALRSAGVQGEATGGGAAGESVVLRGLGDRGSTRALARGAGGGGDYLADAAATGVSLFAIWLARRPASARRRGGYPNATSIAALANRGWLLVLGGHRDGDPPAGVGCALG
jgi:hypothetical protein